jgi:hypothetical protein
VLGGCLTGCCCGWRWPQLWPLLEQRYSAAGGWEERNDGCALTDATGPLSDDAGAHWLGCRSCGSWLGQGGSLGAHPDAACPWGPPQEGEGCAEGGPGRGALRSCCGALPEGLGGCGGWRGGEGRGASVRPEASTAGAVTRSSGKLVCWADGSSLESALGADGP